MLSLCHRETWRPLPGGGEAFLSEAKAHQRRAGKRNRKEYRGRDSAPVGRAIPVRGGGKARMALGTSCPRCFFDIRPSASELASSVYQKSTAAFAAVPFLLCGEGGIRTREPLWEVTRFPDAPLQPLEHLSFAVCGCKYKQKYVNFVILSGNLISIQRKWLRRRYTTR